MKNQNTRSVLKVIVLVAAVICLFLAAISPGFQVLVFDAGWFGLCLWLLASLL